MLLKRPQLLKRKKLHNDKNPPVRHKALQGDVHLGAGFRLSPKELLGGRAPMNGNIVTVILPDLDPVHQLGNYQMLGFI